MQDSMLPSAPNKLISSALGQENRIHFTWSILTITVNDILLLYAVCNEAFIWALIRVLVHCGGRDSLPHPFY